VRRATISIVGGGEPLLYPNFDEILKEAPTQHRRLMIMTNGTLLSSNAMLWKIAQRAAITLSFSIDAATRGTYELIRQNGNWDDLIANIDKTIALRESNPQLHISTSFVVIRQNQHELLDFMRLNTKWGSEYVHIHPAIHSSFPDEWLVDTRSTEFQETIMQAIEYAHAHSIAIDPIEEILPVQDYDSSTPLAAQCTKSSNPNGTDHTSQVSPSDPWRACRYHSSSMTVGVTGEVYLCDTAFRIEYSCGNIFDMGLLNAWLSPAWLSVRLAHHQGLQDEHPLCSRCMLVK